MFKVPSRSAGATRKFKKSASTRRSAPDDGVFAEVRAQAPDPQLFPFRHLRQTHRVDGPGFAQAAGLPQ